MPCPRFTTITTLASLAAVASLTTSGEALAATPVFYDNLVTFEADIADRITDDYSNPGYVFIQSDDVMSAVFNETDYHTTGFMNLNIVSGGTYCAGCNGSFELSFLTTSLGNDAGINAVGLQIVGHDLNNQYSAFITFADGTTQDIPLPGGGTFWGVAAPERIERIHFGLPGGGSTMGGSFQIDDLVIGEGSPESCPGSSIDISTLTQSSGITVTRTGTTTGALDDIDEPAEVACWESTGGPENVFRFVVQEEAWLQIDLEDSEYDTKLAIVDGCPGGENFCAYNDDYVGTTSGFDCTPYAAGIYSLVVGGATGNTGPYTLSVTECSPCGNGSLDPGEVCDDGNTAQDDACVDNCVPASCGDGHTFTGTEECDDGNDVDTDACRNSCVAAICGDGVIQDEVEGCDDQNDDNTDTCVGACVLASCGDGFVFAGFEGCDDGNDVDLDGCTSCQLDSAESSSEGGSSEGESSSGGGETSSTGGTDSGTTGGTTGGSEGGESSGSGGGGETVGVDTSGGPIGDSSGGDGGSSSSTGPGETSGDSGCGCTTDGSRSTTPWLLVVVGALIRGRRRRAA